MFITKLRGYWEKYKYRSVPWLLYNWKRRPVKQVITSIGKNVDTLQEKHLEKLKSLLSRLSKKLPEESNSAIINSEFGFVIEKKKSLIENAGYGVFVTEGFVKSGDLVALYPGTVYYPMEPVFFQSLGNCYILKCIDGVLIDGNSKGISKSIYKSCASRDKIGNRYLCDVSWLSESLKNPLSIGQYVNNENNNFSANVAYLELNIPVSFGLDLMEFLPNINYNPLPCLDQSSIDDTVLVRTVILQANRDIGCNEELFSSYMTEVYGN